MGALRRGWLLLAVAGVAQAQEIPSEPSSPDPVALVEEARTAFESAEFEKTLDLARRAEMALGAAGPRATLARALDLIAQSQFNLGRKREAEATALKLIRLIPGYSVDPNIAGPEYQKYFETRRKKMTGALLPVCRPLPCEAVALNGQPAEVDAQGEIKVLAGEYAVTFSRRGFSPLTLPPVKVEVGARVPLEARLEQIARDVVLLTEPAEVAVSLDGRGVGATLPSGQGTVSRPFVIEELLPGPHTLVLQAPCRRRLEQMIEVVLDAQNPGPLDLGTVSLERATSWIEIRWAEAEGVLTIDGETRQAGRHEVCPGKHEVSLSLGGRRVWFVSPDLGEDEEAVLEPRPRPALAAAPAGLLPQFPGEAWSLLELPPEAAARAERLVSGILAAQPSIPAFPEFLRLELGEAASSLTGAAPEADLWLVAPPAGQGGRPGQSVAWLDLRRGLMEATSLHGGSATAARELGEFLKAEPVLWAADPGLDLVGRMESPPVIAAVEEGGPAAAAGLRPGDEVLALDGKALAWPGEVQAWETRLKPGGTVLFRLRAPGGEEREVALATRRVVDPVPPVSLAGRPVLPQLAFCGVLRLAGDPSRRMAAAVRFALLLGALGLPEALPALDRAVVDDAFDPQGDARGTLQFLQEKLLWKFGQGEYAQEVRGRWKGWNRARFGGRGGPPLNYFR